MSKHNEAYVTVTLKVVLPVSYKGERPTDGECLEHLQGYMEENDPDAAGMFTVVDVEVDMDSVLRDMED